MLNAQFELIRQSPTVAMNDRIVACKAAGQPVIPLQVGDPDFATPQPILEVALRAMQSGQTHYASSQGTPDLRRAAALKLQRDNGLDYDPASELLVTHGGIHAYYTALQSILNPHDPWLTLADFRSYLDAQKRVDAAYQDEENWTRMSIINTATSGKFSSDRTIMDYNRDVWHLPQVKAHQD